VEWEREFDEFVHSGRLPSFEIVRLPQDHTDTKVAGIDRVTGPEIQVADNDYAAAAECRARKKSGKQQIKAQMDRPVASDNNGARMRHKLGYQRRRPATGLTALGCANTLWVFRDLRVRPIG